MYVQFIFRQDLLVLLGTLMYYCKSGNFREFVILGSFAKSRICDLSILVICSTILIIFARLLNSRICPPREIREH